MTSPEHINRVAASLVVVNVRFTDRTTYFRTKADRMCCIPEVVDAGEVVLGVDVDDTGGVVVVTPKTYTKVLRESQCPVNNRSAEFCTSTH